MLASIELSFAKHLRRREEKIGHIEWESLSAI